LSVPRIGTRGSALALAQAEAVARMLGGAEIVPITTMGDRGEGIGDKQRWIADLEDALLAGDIDVAVHSAKDVPSELADGLAILGVPPRADSRDALVGAAALDELPKGARVGTSSLRRRSALLAQRPDLDVLELRGNVDTRLRRLAEGRFDAIVVALAGLERLGRAGEAGGALDPATVVPAPGQGTLLLEGRREDEEMREQAQRITHPPSLAQLTAERSAVEALGATCRTPVGVHATIDGEEMAVRAFAGLPDGSAWLRDEVRGLPADADALGEELGRRLLTAGGAELLARAEELGAA
jgi:hydroxymethylbilane synthase